MKLATALLTSILLLNPACDQEIKVDLPKTSTLMSQDTNSEEISSLELRVEQELLKNNLLKPKLTQTEAEKTVNILLEETKDKDYACLDYAFIMNDLIKRYSLPFKPTLINHKDVGLMLDTKDEGLRYIRFFDPLGRAVKAYSKTKTADKNWTDLKMVDNQYLVSLTETQLLALQHHNKGFILASKNDLKEAVLEFETSTRLFPNWQQGYLAASECYIKQGMMVKARKSFEKAKNIGDSRKLKQFKHHYHF